MYVGSFVVALIWGQDSPSAWPRLSMYLDVK
jgi:hypothetical protein